MGVRFGRRLCGTVVCLLLLVAPTATAGDWPSWRGVAQTGESTETGLISSWSRDGENLLWRADFVGRSTPIVMEGRVYVSGRTGEGTTRQEVVAAYDAENGALLWEHRFNVYLTTVPFNRVGWGSPAGDPETGYIYLQGVGGPFLCLDRDGNVVWSRSLGEEFGRFSGYGGRTHTPLVDEDLVIVSVINSSWGDQGPPRHRYFAFDKRTGDLIWVSTPGGSPYDRNTYSTPAVAVINGQRLFIGGNADGWIYALKTRTGEKVWGFELSKRGINTSIVVAGTRVYAAHSEENVDEATLGRVVCIDGTGRGDVTKTHELWRASQVKVGYASPLRHEGRLYVVDNSANLRSLDAKTGEQYWEHSLGTVGKASPVWADGKIFAPEVNGHFHILALTDDGVKPLDRDKITVPGGRYAEIYGSPAIAYRRIYFTTEEGLYCLGDKTARFAVSSSQAPDLGREEVGSDRPAVLLAIPGEVVARPGGTAPFEVRAFNEKGRVLGTVDAEWRVNGLAATIDTQGKLTLASGGGNQAGTIVARHGGLEARARVRVFADLPWVEDFESVEGRGRPFWIGGGRFQVEELDGNKVLVKPVAARGLLRSKLYIGPAHLSNYTIQADVRGTQNRRRRPDGGLIANGYTLDLMGINQQLEIRSWTAELRMAQNTDFAWEMETWYTMKLRVDVDNERARVRGKVWPKGEEEPEVWTLSVEDRLPVPRGSPGLQAYSPAKFYFDNVKITVNER